MIYLIPRVDIMELIERKGYLDRLKRYTDSNFIKVITGVRRSGKSSMLSLYNGYLCHEYGRKKVLQLNIDTPEFLDINTKDEFATLLSNRVTKDTRYILIDEVQLVSGWERVINAYYATGKYDITITGSNSQMLSSELATHLTGRYVEIKVFPLSYKEFLKFKKLETSIALFDEYLTYGGFPSIVLLDGEREKIDAIRAILDSILYNDILRRNRNFKPELIDKLLALLNDSIGFPVSLNKIMHSLKSIGFKVYYELIADYLKAFEMSYIFLDAQYFYIKGKERFGLVDKYYSIDPGFMNITRSKASQNYGSVLENVVFLELLRRGYDVSIGRENSLEIDFVATRNNEVRYFQVTESLLDPKTREREFKGLSAINDNWPKQILSMDIHDYSEKGIENKNIVEFLLEE